MKIRTDLTITVRQLFFIPGSKLAISSQQSVVGVSVSVSSWEITRLDTSPQNSRVLLSGEYIAGWEGLRKEALGLEKSAGLLISLWVTSFSGF
jgi:hypothetical protein